MNAKDRIIGTIYREEVDRVPHFEWIIDGKVISAICPGYSYEEFVYKMDLDVCLCWSRLQRRRNCTGRF